MAKFIREKRKIIETGMGNKLKIAVHKFVTDVRRITTEPMDEDDTVCLVSFLENELNHSQGNLSDDEYADYHKVIKFDEHFNYSERSG